MTLRDALAQLELDLGTVEQTIAAVPDGPDIWRRRTEALHRLVRQAQRGARGDALGLDQQRDNIDDDRMVVT